LNKSKVYSPENTH